MAFDLKKYLESMRYMPWWGWLLLMAMVYLVFAAYVWHWFCICMCCCGRKNTRELGDVCCCSPCNVFCFIEWVCMKSQLTEPNPDRDIELGQIDTRRRSERDEHSRIREAEQTGRTRLRRAAAYALTERHQGIIFPEDVYAEGEHQQRLVAKMIGWALKSGDRPGARKPPAYEHAGHFPASHAESSGGGPRPTQYTMAPEPPDYGRATGGDPTPQITDTPPTYKQTDPSPRSERRCVKYSGFNADLEALEVLRDHSEDTEEKEGFELGLHRLQKISNYKQPRYYHSRLISREAVACSGDSTHFYVDAIVYDPVKSLVGELLRPTPMTLAELEREAADGRPGVLLEERYSLICCISRTRNSPSYSSSFD